MNPRPGILQLTLDWTQDPETLVYGPQQQESCVRCNLGPLKIHHDGTVKLWANCLTFLFTTPDHHITLDNGLFPSPYQAFARKNRDLVVLPPNDPGYWPMHHLHSQSASHFRTCRSWGDSRAAMSSGAPGEFRVNLTRNVSPSNSAAFRWIKYRRLLASERILNGFGERDVGGFAYVSKPVTYRSSWHPQARPDSLLGPTSI